MCHHYIVNWIYEVINFRFNYLEMSALVSSVQHRSSRDQIACLCNINFDLGRGMELSYWSSKYYFISNYNQ